jgi:hypothetical protein
MDVKINKITRNDDLVTVHGTVDGAEVSSVGWHSHMYRDNDKHGPTENDCKTDAERKKYL